MAASVLDFPKWIIQNYFIFNKLTKKKNETSWQMAALALNFWWGLLTKWLMYLWDKLTDGSLSPIDDFFGGVTRLHIFNLSLKWILEKTENWIRCSLSPIRLRRRIYTYFSSFLKTMLTDDSISPEFNKISHWFLLCTFETSWQIAASALLSGIFETFDNLLWTFIKPLFSKHIALNQIQSQP